ncbi:MAG: phospholipid carrier-dependent glycosyltransferase [Clostridiales bacterium]|nr:phospholipid carrier-dependent glycosyltransferase [Clostridiales bacterium]
MPEGWYTESWFTAEGYTVYDRVEGMENGTAASIHNLGSNDARFAQTVSVEPESLYKLSGYICAEGISDAGWGANLSIEGLYVYTDGLFDTNGDWQYVTMYGETGEDQYEVTVFVRLGGYSGESDGFAAFDNIRLERVDSIPADSIAVRWYQLDHHDIEDDLWTEEDEPEASPFWPYLLILSGCYLILVLCLGAFLCRLPKNSIQSLTHKPYLVVLILFASFIIHYILSLKIYGYPVDINCFLSWGTTMSQYGPSRFYSTTSFCDYPPAYMLVLWLNKAFCNVVAALHGGTMPAWINDVAVLKFIPGICDLALSYCMYRTAVKRGSDQLQASLLALLLAFNPVLLVNSAAWGQVDSVLAFLLVLVAMFAIHGKWQFVMPCYVFAVLVKPQALMLGFLGLSAIVLAWVRGDRSVRKRMLAGIVYAALTALVLILPFAQGQKPGWLLEKYTDTLSSYPYATVNTANLYYLFGFNWTSIDARVSFAPSVFLAFIALGWGLHCAHLLKNRQARMWMLEPMLYSAFTVFFLACGFLSVQWYVLGYGAMAFCVISTTLLYLRSGNIRNLPFLGALLFLLLYTLGIKMHERYLFPAVVFFLLAFVLHRDRRILILFCLSSVTMFVNEGIVLDNAIRLGASLGHLNSDTVWLANILSVVNLLQIPLALWTASDLAIKNVDEKETTVPRFLPIKHFPEKSKSPLTFHPDVSLHWKRIDTFALAAVTIAYSFLAMWNLGSKVAPQHPWTSTSLDEYVVLDLGRPYEDFSFLYYCQVSYQNFTVATSEDGEVWSENYPAQMDQGECFRWKYLMPSHKSGGDTVFTGGNTYHAVQKLSGRYVRIKADQIGLRLCEVILRESSIVEKKDGSQQVVSGSRIPYTVLMRENANTDSPLYSDPQALCDEQNTLEGEPTWYTGTYFDEIYHARTAFEHLQGSNPYETTHPPLGKVIMSWFIALFGMTPFGWRFAGALAGILMLPVMYLLGKQLTKKTSMACAAAILLALDTMHYTQTRIATIDSFPVLFILCSYFFMLRFMQRDLTLSSFRSLLPDLALSGFFMGCAIASKWIGVYAGIGLAVLFFWTLARHLLLAKDSRLMLDTSPESPYRDTLTLRSTRATHVCFNLCLWCLLFFVLIPAAIYLFSYIPYFSYQKPQSLGAYLKLVWKAQQGMLSYHSTPRLGMDHPFYSPWYEWPIIYRPMYYAMAYYSKAGTSFSIFSFGNPAVWWTGIAGVLSTFFVFLKRHRYLCENLPGSFHLNSSSWTVNPAFVLLSLLAQFLPWVLVPRGTYIYHYFASVPFLILAIVLSLNWLEERFGRYGRAIRIIYLVLCLAFFIILFPYASGFSTSYAWLDFAKQFLHVYYALPTG